ncbi:Src y 2 domains [Balamuthia mandrillaris]
MAEEPGKLKGWLLKQGAVGIKTYKRRYFSQKGNEAPWELHYYHSKRPSEKSLGFIDLRTVQGVEEVARSKTGFVLVTPGRNYVLQAAKPEERTYWVKLLGDWLKFLRTKNLSLTDAAPQTAKKDAETPLSPKEQREALLQELEDIRNKLRKKRRMINGLEKLIGFYANNKAQQGTTDQELQELRAAVEALKQRRNEIKEELTQLPAATDAKIYRALYDFTAQSKEELSFQAGASVTFLEKVNEEWFKGESGGKIGILPYNFVTCDDSQQPEQKGAEGGGASPPQQPQSPVVASSYYVPTAVALYDFEKETENELAFKTGDVIELVTYEEGEEWWSGELNGVLGVFPANYVQMNAPPTRQSSSKASKRVTRFSTHSIPTSSRGSIAWKPPAKGTPTSGRARVLFDFEAENEGELTVKAGDLIEVYPQPADDPHDEWTQVELKGVIGMVPTSYIMLLAAGSQSKGSVEEAAEDDAAAAEGEDINSPEGSQGRKAKALFDFEPESESELRLKQGDIVELSSCEEGAEWWSGTLPDGSKGAFPANYVEILSEL